MVSVGEDRYQSRSSMNWRDAEFDQHEPKSWAHAEKCEFQLTRRTLIYKVIEIRVQISEMKLLNIKTLQYEMTIINTPNTIQL